MMKQGLTRSSFLLVASLMSPGDWFLLLLVDAWRKNMQSSLLLSDVFIQWCSALN